MKKLFGTAIAVAVLLILLATAFQSGRSAGFRTGSEWAILQADIVAREAGMALPVRLDDGVFRVVLRQPPGLYQKAWRLADRYDLTAGAIQTAKRSCEKTEF